MRILLKSCCFLLLIINTSCRETSDKKNIIPNDEIENIDSSETETAKDKIILFFGDSLTAGLGLQTEEAFPALIQHRIDSLGLSYQVVNAGLSGETTASGKNRVGWVLNQKVDVFVLELGANDGLRGIPLHETRKNLQLIIDMVREKNSETKIIIAGMQIPPNLGVEYTTEFKNIFPEIAKENNINLIPFLLENVAGIPALNQKDGIHPTPEGHKIVAQNAWAVLEKEL